jgi:hypothetical protein
MKKSIFLLIVLLVATLTPQTRAATPPIDDGWQLLDLPIQGYFSVQFRDGRGTDSGSPYLSWMDGTTTGRGPREVLCDSTASSECSTQKGTLNYFTRLPVCASEAAMDCIESIQSRMAGVNTPMSFVQNFPLKSKTTYIGNTNLNLPAGSSGSIWDIPGAPNSKGTKYFVDVRTRGTKSATDSKFSTTALDMSVYAVDMVKTINDSADAGPVQNSNGPGKEYLGFVGIYPNYANQQVDCVMSGDGLCADRRGMPDGLSFSISLRLSSSPSGWLHGRLADASIKIDPIGSGAAVRLTISGGTQRVPAVGVGMYWKDLPTKLQDAYNANSFNDKLGCRFCSANPLLSTTVSQPNASGSDALNELKAWLPIINNTASADINTWSINTLDPSETNGAPSCFADHSKLLGLVTTNATVYSAGPPDFDGASLNYQVSAPHFMSNGELLKGDYKLILRSDVARCIYKFTAAPIKAVISVITSDGSTDVATTVANESGGWLQLSANNFTFSAPTIQVKLTQDVQTPVVVATPTTQPAVSTPKKTTITCIKGKTTKIVTAVKPTCPAGYKKK